MKEYLECMRTVRSRGVEKPDRTGTGTKSVFGYQMRFDLSEGFPLVTTKRLHLRSIIHELLWFLNGDTNLAYLHENRVSIWDEWADEEGELGPIYGKQWRQWEGKDGRVYDQMSLLLDRIRSDPHSRRLIVSAWKVDELDDMALAPCHTLFQFWVGGGRLSCQLYQRSADLFLGVPFNIASYAMLTHMVAQQTDLEPGEFVWAGGDVHLYNNHLEQVEVQLSREPYPRPTFRLKRRPPSLFEYTFDDFSIEHYQYHPRIKAPIAV
jgi:thymidylate synthase